MCPQTPYQTSGIREVSIAIRALGYLALPCKLLMDDTNLKVGKKKKLPEKSLISNFYSWSKNDSGAPSFAAHV